MKNELLAHKEQFEQLYSKRGMVSSWSSNSPKMYIELGYGKRNREIIKRVPQSFNILDAGCGVGDLISPLTEKAHQFVTGIDISENNIDCSEKNCSDILNVEFYCCSLEYICLPDNYFDTVIMADVIEHVYDPIASMKEIHRVMKHNGTLILTTPNKYMDIFWNVLDYPVVRSLEHIKKTQTIKATDRLFGKKELIDLLTNNGFTIKEHKLIEFYPRLLIFNKIMDSSHGRLDKATMSFCSLIETLKIFNYRQIIVAGKDA